MIKFNAGYIQDRQANLIGLGLTDGNLHLLRLGKPIHVGGEVLDLPGFSMVIFSGVDKNGIQNRLLEIIEPYLVNKDENINVLHMDKTFYVAPFVVNGRPIYAIGLDDVSYKRLREGKFLNFRVRFAEGEGTPVEVILFWGVSEEILEESFYKSGMIGLKTKVTRMQP
jgi:hypothetical protein